MVQIAMTIAGSDNSGGAGIQADLKTFQELGVFGTSALTAVTAQNTQGVHAIQSIDLEIIAAQIEAIFTDFPVHAVKTGMLFSSDIIKVVAEQLKKQEIPLVIDPVMIAKGGASLLQEEAIEALKNELLPIATVVTPNIPEAEVLTGLRIQNNADIEKAAKHILALGAQSVVIKGGHRVDVPDAEDLFMSAAGEKFYVRTPWIDTKDTHGTGCTYADALTAFLAEGKNQADAVVSAKNFIHAAIENGLDIGSGHGPTNHWAYKQQMKAEKHEKGVVIDG